MSDSISFFLVVLDVSSCLIKSLLVIDSWEFSLSDVWLAAFMASCSLYRTL